MVECLLRRSKDLVAINKVAGKWGTALQAAINGDKNPYDTVQLLLDNGADPSIVGGWHGTPLNAAAFRHQYDVAKLLLQHLPSDKIDLVGGRYGTPIQAAVSGSWNASDYPDYREVLRMVDLLLEHDASPILRGGRYETALHAAASQAHIEVAKRLLEQPGVSIDWTDQMGATPTSHGGHAGGLGDGPTPFQLDKYNPHSGQNRPQCSSFCRWKRIFFRSPPHFK
ncbi:hypothetical protein VTN96DRAFT_5656 [Rasamsonia emersonii]